jgi:hypothetical protein
MQLRFASFAVINLRWDFHPQECARAGRTQKREQQLPSSRSAESESGSRFLLLPATGNDTQQAKAG